MTCCLLELQMWSIILEVTARTSKDLVLNFDLDAWPWCWSNKCTRDSVWWWCTCVWSFVTLSWADQNLTKESLWTYRRRIYRNTSALRQVSIKENIYILTKELFAGLKRVRNLKTLDNLLFSVTPTVSWTFCGKTCEIH